MARKSRTHVAVCYKRGLSDFSSIEVRAEETIDLDPGESAVTARRAARRELREEVWAEVERCEQQHNIDVGQRPAPNARR